MNDEKRSVDRTGLVLSAVCLIASVAGTAAYLLPWCQYGGGFTGLEFLTGEASDVMSGLQAYVPTVALVLMIVLLLFSLAGITSRGLGMTPYGTIVFGFIALAVVMVFGNWKPVDGVQMLTDGGTGFYLALVASIVYVFAGIARYMTRPVPARTPPRRGVRDQTRGHRPRSRSIRRRPALQRTSKGGCPTSPKRAGNGLRGRTRRVRP